MDTRLVRGRAMPILGRRGLTVSAISGVDMALWDLLGRSFDAPVLDLWGGARHDRPAGVRIRGLGRRHGDR